MHYWARRSNDNVANLTAFEQMPPEEKKKTNENEREKICMNVGRKTNVNKVNWYVIFFWFIVCNFNSFPYTTIFKLAAINHPSIYLSIHPSIHFLHTGSSTFSNSLRFQYLFLNNKWLAGVHTEDRILNTVIVHLLHYHRQDRKHRDKLGFQREKKTQQQQLQNWCRVRQ